MSNDSFDDLTDRIRRDAASKNLTPAGVIGRFDALDPTDLEDVRRLLESDAEPITEADRTDPDDARENLSVEKSRKTNTGDGDGFDEDTDARGDSDTPINSIIRPGKVPTDTADPVEEDTPAGRGENPTPEGGFSPSTPWFDAEVSAPRSGIYPPDPDERTTWMGAVGKQAFAPWGDRDHPEAEPEKDARWKWGLEENYADGPTVDEWEEKDPRIDGRAFVQLESDPFAFVDGDDVRDPDTGAVHPVFRALLEHLGATYADISTSGAGVHATYHAPDGLPRDLPEAKWQIDTEPWGANDEPPKVEIYANTHLAITHGDHIPGSPLEVREWDETALRAILEANGKLPEKNPSTVREDYDLNGYEPTATTADETTDDIRDIFRALDHLDPKRVGDRTIVREWTRDQRSFLPVWGSSNDNGTANYIDDRIWHDTGHDGGYGGPVVMAAIDAGLINHTGATPADVRGRTFFEAVDHLRDLGFSIPEFDPAPAPADADPVAILPNTPVDRADRFGPLTADRREEHDPIQERRDRVTDAIADAYERADRTLIEALPTLGKTHSAVKAAAETGIPTAILTTRGRKEQYAELAEKCEKFGLSYTKLPAFTHDCETANGDHGEDWRNTVMGWYRSGATPKQIHKYAEEVLDRPLPCQADGRTCKYAAKWAALDAAPDTEEPVDVLIGHYTHAHKRKVTTGRAVAIDEFPGEAYETTLAGEHEVAGAVSTYLDRTPQVPYEDYTDLLEHRDDDARRSDALAFLVDDLDPDAREAFDGRQGHAYAPLVVFTLLASDDFGNGFERATFPDDDPRTGLFDRENHRVHIHTPPEFDLARSVVALDGTPTKRLWELSLDERLNHRRVLSDAERVEYIDEILGWNIFSTTDAIKSYEPKATEIKNRVSLKEDTALLEGIAEEHGERPGLITTKRAEGVYDAEGVLDLAEETKHYGNVKGSNEFKHTRVGAVIGSRNYGPNYVKKWGAYAGESVEPTFPCPENDFTPTEYGEFGNKIRTHMREHETLQAAMRFGRDGNGATVYVHTNTLPDWVPIAGEGRVINTWSDGMKQVLEAGEELDTFRTKAIAEHPAVDISQRQVFDHLNTLAERGYLAREHAGKGYTWHDDGLHEVNEHGDVDLDAVDLEAYDTESVQEVARSSIYTWEFRKDGADSESDTVGVGGNGGENRSAIATGGNDPPEPGD